MISKLIQYKRISILFISTLSLLLYMLLILNLRINSYDSNIKEVELSSSLIQAKFNYLIQKEIIDNNKKSISREEVSKIMKKIVEGCQLDFSKYHIILMSRKTKNIIWSNTNIYIYSNILHFLHDSNKFREFTKTQNTLVSNHIIVVRQIPAVDQEFELKGANALTLVVIKYDQILDKKYLYLFIIYLVIIILEYCFFTRILENINKRLKGCI